MKKPLLIQILLMSIFSIINLSVLESQTRVDTVKFFVDGKLSYVDLIKGDTLICYYPANNYTIGRVKTDSSHILYTQEDTVYYRYTKIFIKGVDPVLKDGYCNGTRKDGEGCNNRVSNEKGVYFCRWHD